MPDDKNLYAVLGVHETASAEEIKKAYRKLARTWHPDVRPDDPEAEQRFKEISAAHDVLSDPKRRKLYDEFGQAGLRQGFDPEQARQYRAWRPGRASTAGVGGSPGPGNAGDWFNFDVGDLSDFFGGRVPSRGRNIQATVELDFVEALNGKELQVQVPSVAACPDCSGTGQRSNSTPERCPDCQGSGRRKVAQGPVQMLTTCPTCQGTGNRSAPCTRCNGRGHLPEQQRIKVRIPMGAEDGSVLTVKGRGMPGPTGGAHGDLLITTRVRSHPCFSREGMDLKLALPVTLDELYNGAKVDIPTPAGSVQMRIPAGTQPGATLRLRGKGVTRKAQSGDLYVTLALKLPPADQAEFSELAKQANAFYDDALREHIKL